MNNIRTTIIICLASLIVGFFIGGYFFTCFAMTDSIGRQNGLLLGVRNYIETKQDAKAKSLIEHTIDQNLGALQKIQKPNMFGLYYFNPANIQECYRNTSANTMVLKAQLLDTPTELSASSISYLKNHNGP